MTLSDKIEKSIRQIRNTAYAVFSLFAAAILYSVITTTTVAVRQQNTDMQVQKIIDDYAPFVLVEAINGSNNELINVINSLDGTTKNDPRYLEAIKNRNDFNRTIIQLIARSKRGGEEIVSATTDSTE